MSAEIINNLQSQLKIYQQIFEQLNNSEAPTSSTPFTLFTLFTPSASFILFTHDIVERPIMGYIKTEEILKLFNMTKVEYNNILVRINDILNPLF